MEDDEKNIEKNFISYLDDDNEKKDQWVIIINKTDFGVEFKFNSNEEQTIFIPWSRVLKIKSRGEDNNG